MFSAGPEPMFLIGNTIRWFSSVARLRQERGLCTDHMKLLVLVVNRNENGTVGLLDFSAREVDLTPTPVERNCGNDDGCERDRREHERGEDRGVNVVGELQREDHARKAQAGGRTRQTLVSPTPQRRRRCPALPALGWRAFAATISQFSTAGSRARCARLPQARGERRVGPRVLVHRLRLSRHARAASANDAPPDMSATRRFCRRGVSLSRLATGKVHTARDRFLAFFPPLPQPRGRVGATVGPPPPLSYRKKSVHGRPVSWLLNVEFDRLQRSVSVFGVTLPFQVNVVRPTLAVIGSKFESDHV